MNPLFIQTRQNPKGKWWCSTTYDGYDYFELGETIAEAQQLLLDVLERLGYTGPFEFETPKYLNHQEKTDKTDYIGYAPYRIDKGMI